MTDPTLLNTALAFAARAHDGQKRKGTDVPYIVHPVGVMLVLIECGETDPELLAAALLHDTLEDTGATLDELRRAFGERVAAIVEGCSEPNRNDSWENRKHHTIEFLKSAPAEIALVSAADKVHNIRSMRADFAAQGDQLWRRFKRGRTEIEWYYRSILASLQQGALREHAVVNRLGQAVGDLFGR